MIQVALIDDHPLMADGTRVGPETAPDLTVAWTAHSIAEARAALAEDPDAVDVVILDIRLQDGSGYELLPGTSSTRPAYLVMSQFDRPLYAAHAFERGAVGYLTKTTPIDEVVDAVRQAAAGRLVFTVEQLRTIQARPAFSRREHTIVRLVARSYSNDEIAARLGISPKTIEAHLREIYRRQRFSTRTELSMWAAEEGWLEINDTEA